MPTARGSRTPDLHPTFCAAAGAAVPAGTRLDGVNLLPHLLGETAGPPHETLFWRKDDQGAVRQGDWKLLISPGIRLIGGNEQGLKASSWTEEGNVFADPQLDATFRSHAFDSQQYGANLDVRVIPYRRFSGDLYPIHHP